MALVLRSTNGKGNASPFWYAAFNYRGPDGRLVRVKKSTGSKDKREAQRIANELELRAHELATGRGTVEQMRAVLADLTERITGESIADYTTEAWLKEWMTQKAAISRAKTVVRYRVILDRFLAFLGRKAKAGLQHVRPGDVRAFRDSLMDTGKTGYTCNLELKVVAMPFRKAHKLGIIRINPAEAVETLEDDRERREPFTLEQVRAILAHAPNDDWRGMIRLGFYTGARLSDCARMKWGNVDLHARTLAFAPAKTARGKRPKQLFLPIHPDLHAWLMKLPAPDDGEAFLFPSLANVGSSGNKGLSRQFIAIMDTAGVSAPLAREKGNVREGSKSAGRSTRALSFHSLRHTLTSNMHNAGVSAELRMQFTGHASGEAHEIYTHTELETLRGALASVPSL